MEKLLSTEVMAQCFVTTRHIDRVRQLLNRVITDLLTRGEEHDQSKIESPEAEVFAEFNDKLAATTFGSPEFIANKAAMRPTLEHHYARNRHHPEHHKNGVDDMNLLDAIEMLVDWKASSERHNDGNILKSIEINSNHFHISPQLRRILENTAKLLDGA